MTPEQAAALYNHTVWENFGKTYRCVAGFDSLRRIQEHIDNDPEDLERMAVGLEDWAANFRVWADLQKAVELQRDIEEAQSRKRKPTKKKQVNLFDKGDDSE